MQRQESMLIVIYFVARKVYSFPQLLHCNLEYDSLPSAVGDHCSSSRVLFMASFLKFKLLGIFTICKSMRVVLTNCFKLSKIYSHNQVALSVYALVYCDLMCMLSPYAVSLLWAGHSCLL